MAGITRPSLRAKTLRNVALSNLSLADKKCIEEVFEKFEELATEVKHGEWRQNQHCRRIYYCSVCGRHIEDASQRPKEFFPYCHCGAKMDGGS